MYILRAGFLDGPAGIIVCAITGYYTFLKFAKLWEFQRNGMEAGLAAERNHQWKGPSVEQDQGNAVLSNNHKAA
jgi:hypothetical protein